MAIHGVYIGMLAQEVYETFDEETQKDLYDWSVKLLDEIYIEEVGLIEEIYDKVDLSHDVKIFVRYNANKAMMNLGFDIYFPEEDVNPVVLNGLNTESKVHDYFSNKGNSYSMIETEQLSDDDFNFDFD